MHRLVNALVLGSFVAIGIVNTVGCGKEDGPAEEAGEEVDKAVDKLKDKVD